MTGFYKLLKRFLADLFSGVRKRAVSDELMVVKPARVVVRSRR